MGGNTDSSLFGGGIDQTASELDALQKQKADQLETLRIRLMRQRGRGLLTQNVPNTTLG